MSKENIQSINLLEPIAEPEDMWLKAYDWVTSIGRIILVVTEIIVVGVLIARFTYDGINNDLTEDINDIIETSLNSRESRDSERDFRRYMALFRDIEKVKDGQQKNSRRVSLILDTLPDTLYLESVSIQEDRVSLMLSAQSFEDISAYTARLNKQYSEVGVSVSKDMGTDEQLISVSITFKLEEV